MPPTEHLLARWLVRVTSFGLGTPIAGRDRDTLVNTLVESMCEKMRHPEADRRQTEDVVLTFRGRILAAIQQNDGNPIVKRFDPPASPGPVQPVCTRQRAPLCREPDESTRTGRSDLRPDRPVHLQE